MQNKRNYILVKLFTIYVCLIPILEYYNSPIGLVNCSTFLAIVFSCFFLVIGVFNKKSANKKLLIVSFFYILFIALNTITTSALNNYDFSWSNISPLFRLIVLFSCVIFLGNSFFDFKFALKTLRIIICAASLLIIFQYILKYGFNVNFHPVIVSMLRDKGYSEIGTRFSAFYMEPAHFAFSATLYLILELFSNCEKKQKTFFIIAAILGIVLSGSGQGYLFLFVIYFFWLLKMLYLSRKQSNHFFVAIGSVLVILILCFIGFQIPYVQYSLSRVISENGSFGGLALDGRVSTKIFFESLSTKQKWFGIGFGHVKDLTKLYVSSFYTHLIECGYLSIAFLVLLVVPCLVEKKYFKYVLFVFFSLTVFFASGANPATLTFVLPFFYLDNNVFSKKVVLTQHYIKQDIYNMSWSR